MTFLLLTLANAFSAELCLDLVERQANSICLTPAGSYEMDMGSGPVIIYDCDLGDDFEQSEVIAVFSLSTDAAPFFESDPIECSGGDLWVDPGDPYDPGTGVSVSWLSWAMFHEWDDERAAGEMSHLDDWLVEQSIVNLHRGGN